VPWVRLDRRVARHHLVVRPLARDRELSLVSVTRRQMVPSVLLSPIAVTKDNIQDTVIKDGFLTTDEICTGKYASACKEAGIE